MSRFIIECSDPELRERLHRMSARDVGLPPELRPVFALMDACDFYGLLEGRESAKVQEVIRLLISEDLRPALRKWYQGSGDSLNPWATQFRERLGELAGEKFE